MENILEKNKAVEKFLAVNWDSLGEYIEKSGSLPLLQTVCPDNILILHKCLHGEDPFFGPDEISLNPRKFLLE